MLKRSDESGEQGALEFGLLRGERPLVNFETLGDGVVEDILLGGGVRSLHSLREGKQNF